jgi:hypothetical protein
VNGPFRAALTLAHLARSAAAILARDFADNFRRLRPGFVTLQVAISIQWPRIGVGTTPSRKQISRPLVGSLSVSDGGSERLNLLTRPIGIDTSEIPRTPC